MRSIAVTLAFGLGAVGCNVPSIARSTTAASTSEAEKNGRRRAISSSPPSLNEKMLKVLFEVTADINGNVNVSL